MDRLVGIETLGGVFTEIVAAGCPLPCEVTQIFSTAADDQTQIALHLYRGPAGLVSEAEAIGSWEVTGFALLGALCVPIIERLPFQRPVVATLGGFASGRPKASPAAHVVRHPLGSGVLAAPTVATLFGLREARRQPEQDLERQVVCVAADLKPFRGAFRLP